MNNFTPRPWEVRETGPLAGRYEVVGANAGEDHANVALIAAAPTLYEALKYARRFMKPDLIDLVYIDQIIAKAEGREE